MIKFKAVAFGLFILISSICSSTEARAESIVEDLTEEKVVLTKIFGELKNKIVSDLGKEGGDVIVRPGMKHPVAETIKQCNIIEKRLMKIEHELNIINKAETENLPYAIWLSNDKKGKEPEATYDEETLKKSMNDDDIVLQLKHDFIETPGLPLGRFFYEAFKENSRGSKLHDAQETLSTAPRLVAEHTASLNRFTTAFSGARNHLNTAREAIGDLIHPAYDAHDIKLVHTLDQAYQYTENAVDTLDNAPIPITYTNLSVSLNNAADHLDYLTGFYTNELNRPADANATRAVATRTRTAATDAISTTRRITASIYT